MVDGAEWRDEPDAESVGTDMARMSRMWMSAQPAVTAFISSMVHDHHDAEDVLQETAQTVAARFGEYRPDRPFLGWVLRIAKMQVYEHWRRRGQQDQMLSITAVEELAREFETSGAPSTEVVDALNECIEKLPPRPRRLVEWRYARDMKPGAIAERLGMSANSVRVTLHRIRSALQKCVAERLGRGDLK